MTAVPVPTELDLTAVRQRQRQTWASGDFAVVAARIALTGEALADAADLRAGWRVLDIGCGSGNATLAAARSGTKVTGVDYVPAVLDRARARAAAEGLDIEFRTGDAEDLPATDGTFDAVLSVFGVMFAPDHRRAAAEIVRVARPGGTVALASWTPDGFVGQMLRVVASYVPAPPGLAPPVLWGTPAHLAALFGDSATDIRSTEQTCVFRYASAEEFVGFFRRWYGPTLKAFEALDEAGRAALARDLADLARRNDRYRDGGSIAVPATYLQTVLTLR